MVIGSRIREARIKLGLSQEELGSSIGVSKVSICGYEQGNRTPTMDNFVDLCNVLHVDVNYLLGLDTPAVSESSELAVKVRKEDLKLIKELRKNKKLYNSLIEEPARTIKLIDKKLYR